jgi:hypothetical protein
MYNIQYFGKDNFTPWLVAIGFALVLWSQLVITFHMPNEQDLDSERYREEANKVAIALLVDTEKKIWSERGFVETYTAPKSMSVEGKDMNRSKDIMEITKYFGNGSYQIYTGSSVKLSASSEDKKTTFSKGFIEKEYIVTIKAKPKRNWYGTVNLNWQISDIKLVKSSNSELQIAKMLKEWKLPPSKKPDW